MNLNYLYYENFSDKKKFRAFVIEFAYFSP